MLKRERQDRILQLVTEKQYCTVKELSGVLYVAPITIRRDLEEMESAGLVRRCHGGAALQDYQNREVPFALRDRENAMAKARLGQKAAALLRPGDTVFMDASTTVTHIIDYITSEQNLTIITNSVRILEKLRGQHIRCYLTGGMLLENSYALVGKIAEETVSAMYADICFFSSQGITEDGVITDYSEDETRLRQCMIRHAKKSVFLFDRSKIGKQFLFRVCDARDLHGIITDGKFSLH
jgi:DeoR/GlpR family transcriptional regulator of sugar metabolism